MPNGTVKFFNAAKGFGFITPEDGTKDIFVPATSITAAGVANLKTGQRVSFEILPDTKGPKAVDLKIIAPAPAPTPKPPKHDPAPPAKSGNTLTLYFDPASTAAEDVLGELHRSGHEPLVVDYMASPPSKEDLKKLSLMLRESDQSAVRKYEPLFRELRLDDRFISDGEYWEAIFEHPALINGPILTTAAKAMVCRSKADVKSFLSVPVTDSAGSPAKRKELSPVLLRLISGNAAPPPVPEKAPIEKRQPTIEAPPVMKLQIAAKPKAVKKPVAKPKPPAKAKPAPKAAARKPVKKAAAKKR